MRLQRVRGAENRAEMQLVKWTAEGMVKGTFPSLGGVARSAGVVAEYSMT